MPAGGMVLLFVLACAPADWRCCLFSLRFGPPQVEMALPQRFLALLAQALSTSPGSHVNLRRRQPALGLHCNVEYRGAVYTSIYCSAPRP